MLTVTIIVVNVVIVVIISIIKIDDKQVLYKHSKYLIQEVYKVYVRVSLLIVSVLIIIIAIHAGTRHAQPTFENRQHGITMCSW